MSNKMLEHEFMKLSNNQKCIHVQQVSRVSARLYERETVLTEYAPNILPHTRGRDQWPKFTNMG